MVRERTGNPEADGPWDSRRPWPPPRPAAGRPAPRRPAAPRPGYEFDGPQIRYTPTVTGPPQPIADDRPGFEFDGPFPVAHRRRAPGPVPLPPRRPPPGASPYADHGPRDDGDLRAVGDLPASSHASAHAEWIRLLRLHRAEPRETAYRRFRANLHFKGWGLRLALPIASMTAVGVAVVVLAGANSGAGSSAPPGTVSTLGFPPATLAGRDFAAAASSRGVTLQLGRVASDGPELVAIGAESGTLVPRTEFFISHNAGTSWSLAAESALDGGAPQPGHAPRLIAGGAGGWVALGQDSVWTSTTGTAWTLRSVTGLPGVNVLRRTGSGFIAAGQDGIFLSASGASWRRVAAPPGALDVRYAAASANRIVIAGDVPGVRTPVSGAWLSADGGRTWSPVPVPGGHGSSGQIAGIATVPGGFVLVRPASSGGFPAADVYRSADGATWRFAATLRNLAPALLNGGPSGAVLASPGLVLTSPDGVTWRRTALDQASIAGAAATPGGAVLTTVGAAGPGFEVVGAGGAVTRTSLASVPGALQPQLAVTAVAAHDSEQVAVGGANGYPAVWTSTDGGTNWERSIGVRLDVFHRPGSQQLSSVTYAAQGWLAVGGVSAGAAQHPVVITSVDGRVWTAADGEQAFAGDGLVATQAAAGPAGYVIVGYQQLPGGGTRAVAWLARGLTDWQRVPDGILGASDGVTGGRQLLAVTYAGARGFVAVGRQGETPAVWLSQDGRNWTVSALQLPPAAAGGELLHVAAANGTIVATGMIKTPQGALAPYAVRSGDGGATWTQTLLPVPRGTAVVTALAAAGGSFTATGTFGTTPGNRDVVIWTSPDGRTWTAATPGGAGLAGPGIQAITGLTASGSTLTGVGFTATPATQSPLFWQAPVR